MWQDDRLPIYLEAPPVLAGEIAWLVEGDVAAPGPIVERFTLDPVHAPGCTCCLPRGAAARALGRLFLRRARGDVAPFTAVAVRARGAAGAAAVAAAVTSDVLARARFRLAG
jgi:hypothetical protein